MRKGGTHKTIRDLRRLTLVMLALSITTIIVCKIALDKKSNYSDLHRAVRRLEIIHGLD